MIDALSLSLDIGAVVAADGQLAVKTLKTRIAHACLVHALAVIVARVIAALVRAVRSVPACSTVAHSGFTVTHTALLRLTAIRLARAIKAVLTSVSGVTHAHTR